MTTPLQIPPSRVTALYSNKRVTEQYSNKRAVESIKQLHENSANEILDFCDSSPEHSQLSAAEDEISRFQKEEGQQRAKYTISDGAKQVI